MLSPGLAHNPFVAKIAGVNVMDVIRVHSKADVVAVLIGAASITLVAYLLKENKGYVAGTGAGVADGGERFKPKPLFAVIPILPVLILVLGATGIFLSSSSSSLAITNRGCEPSTKPCGAVFTCYPSPLRFPLKSATWSSRTNCAKSGLESCNGRLTAVCLGSGKDCNHLPSLRIRPTTISLQRIGWGCGSKNVVKSRTPTLRLQPICLRAGAIGAPATANMQVRKRAFRKLLKHTDLFERVPLERFP
jgi:hypothetical protein